MRSAVVTGIPRTVVTWCAGRYEVQWPLIRGCRGTLSPSTSTSGYLSSHLMKFPSIARDRWLSTAPSPHALTAAR